MCRKVRRFISSSKSIGIVLAKWTNRKEPRTDGDYLLVYAAGLQFAGLETAAERGDPLLRRAMGERFGTDASGSHSLKTIVTDGSGRAETSFHVSLINKITLLRTVTPYAREAIGLEFHANGKLIPLSRI